MHSKNGILGLYGLAMTMTHDLYDDVNKLNSRSAGYTSSNVDMTPKPKVIPKGCKEYKFREGKMEFKCIALSEKSARKKFDRFKKN